MAKKQDATKKDTAQTEEQKQRTEVVGTAADPKPPEAGSVGLNDGTKSNVDEEPGIKTNLREGASVADGNERIGLGDGTVGTREDVKPGAVIIGEDEPANGTEFDREPSPAEAETIMASQLNPKASTDPVINGLFDPMTGVAGTRDGFVEPGTTVGDEAPGMIPLDERYVGVNTELLPGIKAAVDRVNVAREHGKPLSAYRALEDLKEALGPVDAGTSSKLREWAEGQRKELDKEDDKARRKADKAAAEERNKK